MNLTELLAYLRDQIDEKVEARWFNVDLTRYLNVEYRSLCNAIKQKRGNYYEKEGVVTTVANIKTADLPADFSGALIALTCGNTPLIPRDRREFVYLKSDSRSQPRYFGFLGGSKLWLHPVPDKIYSLDVTYEYVPVAMTLGTDTPEIPEGYEPLIVWGAIIQAKLKDYQDIQSIMYRYQESKKEMLQNMKPKQTFLNRRVRKV